MNTLIIEHVDNDTTALFEQLAKKLGLAVKTKAEKKNPGVITNPELLKRIEEIEMGKAKLLTIDLDALKKMVNA